MYRLHLEGQPEDVPSDVVFRIAPDVAMGAKELVVQQTVAEHGLSRRPTFGSPDRPTTSSVGPGR